MWWNAPGGSLRPSLRGFRTRLGCLLLVACAVTSVSAQPSPQSGMLEQTGWRALAAGDARAVAGLSAKALAKADRALLRRETSTAARRATMRAQRAQSGALGVPAKRPRGVRGAALSNQ